MKKLNLGILGMSEGNGHPYSWSAIFNGYDKKHMANCPFPVIPEYLAKQNFPEAMIDDAKVTHIWTQSRAISEDIAAAAYIPNIVDDVNAMIEEVDAVLLARDDAKQHYSMAKPFINAGLPIYIDKPLSLSCPEAEKIYESEQYPGQIFTCSAFQYSDEYQLKPSEKNSLGDMIEIHAQIHKDWDRYAIHLIEPILRLVGDTPKIIDFSVHQTDTCKSVTYYFDTPLSVCIQTYPHKAVKPRIKIIGSRDSVELELTDTFNAFKNALLAFINHVRNPNKMSDKKFVLSCIKMLEIGNE